MMNMKKLPSFMVLTAVLALSSCGSYQYVGQTSDGIYGSTTENTPQEDIAIPAENNNDYYSNYFKEHPIKNIHPCHCTSLEYKIKLSKSANVIDVGVGLSLNYS